MIKEKANIAVFISGRGTNLKALILRSKREKCNYKVAYVISNKKNAAGLRIAKKNKILTKIISQSFLKTEQKKLAKILINNNIKFICLAGFMKILSPYFLNFFKRKIINIHPSLLPKYKGLNTHQRALNAKEKFSGCTIHYVSKRLDSGKIIAKKKVKIFKKDSLKKLEKRVLKEENKLYPLILEKLIKS
ncbi:phosphoribosylglycinamide formyltransferase [Candidatus Pelagibacter sp.]|nr:phosphoribosylglycinamide formyltransferase [Candidatus Pelagibacter sp.]